MDPAERAGFVQEVVETVVHNIDINGRIAQATKDVRQQGRQALMELQTQLGDQNKVLAQAVEEHLDRHQKLRDEHEKLKDATEDLVRLLLPWAPGLNCPTNERREGVLPATTFPFAQPYMAVAGSSGFASYSISLRKADGLGLGLEVTRLEDPPGLRVESIDPAGVVEAWNRRCIGDFPPERIVRPHDVIIAVNGHGMPDVMLKEFETQWVLRLTLVRGSHLQAEQLQARAAGAAAPPTCGNVFLRPDAPEFQPVGENSSATIAPRVLQPRQPSLPAIPEDEAEPDSENTDAKGKVLGTMADRGLLQPNKSKVASSNWHNRRAEDAIYCDKENVPHHAR